MRLDDREFLRRQRALDFIRRPNVKLAFVAFRISVQRRVIATRRRLHFTQYPRGRFARRLHKQFALCVVFGNQPGIGQQTQQRAVVVEHFFKMRNGPFAIDGIARKTATQLVEQPAQAHTLQRETGCMTRIGIARFGITPQAEIKHFRMRKFRCRAEPAVTSVERSQHLRQCGVDRLACWR